MNESGPPLNLALLQAAGKACRAGQSFATRSGSLNTWFEYIFFTQTRDRKKDAGVRERKRKANIPCPANS